MNDPKMVSRIQHLLNKTVANGCTESEAMSAAALAADLLLKYNIDNIGAGELYTSDDIFDSAVKIRRGRWHWQVKLASTIANVTNCDYMYYPPIRRLADSEYYKPRIVFSGLDLNTQVAAQLHNWLIDQFMVLMFNTKFKLIKEKQTLGSDFSKSYLEGICIRVQERLRVEWNSSNERAMVPMKEAITKHMQETWPSLFKKNGESKSGGTWSTKTNNTNAYSMGKEAGDKVRIRKMGQLSIGK